LVVLDKGPEGLSPPPLSPKQQQRKQEPRERFSQKSSVQRWFAASAGPNKHENRPQQSPSIDRFLKLCLVFYDFIDFF
jgi:hypothetical protein